MYWNARGKLIVTTDQSGQEWATWSSALGSLPRSLGVGICAGGGATHSGCSTLRSCVDAGEGDVSRRLRRDGHPLSRHGGV
jgi:hypothetical protein